MGLMTSSSQSKRCARIWDREQKLPNFAHHARGCFFLAHLFRWPEDVLKPIKKMCNNLRLEAKVTKLCPPPSREKPADSDHLTNSLSPHTHTRIHPPSPLTHTHTHTHTHMRAHSSAQQIHTPTHTPTLLDRGTLVALTQSNGNDALAAPAIAEPRFRTWPVTKTAVIYEDLLGLTLGTDQRRIYAT